jgi:hypothetical protein
MRDSDNNSSLARVRGPGMSIDLANRVRSWLTDRLTSDQDRARIREAIAASLAEEDRGWRPLSSGTTRDVPYSQLVENLNDAAEAWRSNPIAFRIVELTTDYVLGKGVRIWAADPAVQRFVDKWWAHPLNTLDTRQFDWSRELALSGELFITFHTNPFDGMSYVRTVPAISIDQVETNPDDVEDETRYHQLAQVTITDGITHPLPGPPQASLGLPGPPWAWPGTGGQGQVARDRWLGTGG